ncbi:MAG: sulfite exporter TauE/SafE family protein [Actinomycetota bacterium]|nr:sulfite exporter TauE/SafE family protein [Actinomycetota bacterium]
MKEILVGFVSGYLSGQFGVGGGVITTPAIRLILGYSPWIALGTPLPVIIPSALTGAYIYHRSKLVDERLALQLAIPGVIGVVLGSAITLLFPGHLIMLITALVILLLGIKFLIPQKVGGRNDPSCTGRHFFRSNRSTILVTGFGCGFFSGFLGLGGGFLLIPAMIILSEKSIKEAFGTSLAVITAYTLPGSIAHYFLKHVDVKLALLLILGVVPGVYLGSKITIKLRESLVRFLFGLFLLIIALYFAYFEVLSWSWL